MIKEYFQIKVLLMCSVNHMLILREAIQRKDIGFIYLDPLPPPLSKNIKNKDILVNFLTPSLPHKIRTYDFLFLGISIVYPCYKMLAMSAVPLQGKALGKDCEGLGTWGTIHPVAPYTCLSLPLKWRVKKKIYGKFHKGSWPPLLWKKKNIFFSN